MAEITLFGFPNSTYVRTARMALAEKAVAYDLEPWMPGTPSLAPLHPFGRVPAFRHGELVLFETFAIARYVDEAFDGPLLQPKGLADRAIMTQWVSAIVDSVYPAVIRAYALPLLLAKLRGQDPDEGAIAAGVPDMEAALAVVDRGCATTEYLAGDRISLADLFLFPIIAAAARAPASARRLKQCPNLKRWFALVSSRPSVEGTAPPPWPSQTGRPVTDTVS